MVLKRVPFTSITSIPQVRAFEGCKEITIYFLKKMI